MAHHQLSPKNKTKSSTTPSPLTLLQVYYGRIDPRITKRPVPLYLQTCLLLTQIMSITHSKSITATSQNVPEFLNSSEVKVNNELLKLNDSKSKVLLSNSSSQIISARKKIKYISAITIALQEQSNSNFKIYRHDLPYFSNRN